MLIVRRCASLTENLKAMWDMEDFFVWQLQITHYEEHANKHNLNGWQLLSTWTNRQQTANIVYGYKNYGYAWNEYLVTKQSSK